MGNNLCKESSSNRPANAKGPVDRFFGQCRKLCPNRVGMKKEYNWNKHIYETRPPRHHEPTVDDGWKTISLPRPTTTKTVVDAGAPVPPPRKKRTSMLSLKVQDDDGIRNGFKDVFGTSSPRRYSYESIHNSKRYRERGIDTEMPVRNSVSCNVVNDDGFSDFGGERSPTKPDKIRKVLPKVGNKKSDKFFGENLSDLSDEGIETSQSSSQKLAKVEVERGGVSPKDPIDRFIEANAPEKLYSEVHHHDTQSGRDSLDRKAKFLENMLDRHCKEPCYDGREPVQEEIIVPKKKITRHICDKDDFHKHFHKKEKCGTEKCSTEVDSVPKKPQRDFGIYRKSQENLAEKAEDPKVHAPQRQKKSVSRESLPSPPDRPHRISDSIILSKSQENLLSASPTKDLELETPQLLLNLVSTKTKSVTPPPSPDVPRKVERNRRTRTSDASLNDLEAEQEMPANLPDHPKRKQFKKSHSSNTFLTQDVMQKMRQKVLEYQLSTELLLEDIVLTNSDDSELVHPTSKIEKPPKKKTSNASTCTVKTDSTEEMAAGGAVAENLPHNHHHEKAETESTASQQSSTPSLLHERQGLRRQEDKKDVAEMPAEENVFNQLSLIQAESNLENILKSESLDMNIISDVLDDIYDKTVLEEFQNYLENEGIDMVSASKKKPNIKAPIAIVEQRPKSPVVDHHRSSQPDLPILPKDWRDSEADKRSSGSISDDGYNNLVKTHSKEEINGKALLAVVQTQGRRESIVDVDNWFNNHIDTSADRGVEVVLNEARKGRRGSDFLVGYDTTSVFPFGIQQRSRQNSVSSEFFEDRNLSQSVENLKGSNQSLNKDHSGLLKFIVDESNSGEAEKRKNAKNRSSSETKLDRMDSTTVSKSEDQQQGSTTAAVKSVIPSIMVTEDTTTTGANPTRGKEIKEKLLKDSLSD